MTLSNLGIVRISADDTAGAAQVMYGKDFVSVCSFHFSYARGYLYSDT